MSCPICGANCKCRKRGPNGECCSCHRHKPSKRMKPEFLVQLEGLDPFETGFKIRDLHKLESQPKQMVLQ